MKKFLWLIVCLMTMISANAQKWSTSLIKGDELKGTITYKSISYESQKAGGLFILSSLTDRVCVGVLRGIIDYDVNDRAGVTIGYYNSNGKLIDSRKNVTFLKLSSTSGFIYSDEIIKEIYQYLSSKTGYIRMLVPRYDRDDLDIKIPCNKLVPKIK